jgi:hypothetical protein
MSKSLRSYVLFIVLAVLSLGLGLSSLLLWVVFPRGYHPTRQLWVDIHKWGGLALSLAALLHVSLHWGWLKRMTRRYLGLRKAHHIEVETTELTA